MERCDIDRFLAFMHRYGLPGSCPREGMMTMIEASEVDRWPVIDIVCLVLDGDLQNIHLLPEKHGFKSILVDPIEVQNALGAASH